MHESFRLDRDLESSLWTDRAQILLTWSRFLDDQWAPAAPLVRGVVIRPPSRVWTQPQPWLLDWRNARSSGAEGELVGSRSLRITGAPCCAR